MPRWPFLPLILKRTNRAADWPEYLYSWAVEPRCSLTHSSADFSGISAYLLSHKQNFKKHTKKKPQKTQPPKTTRALFSSLSFLSFALSPSGCPCKRVTCWYWHFSHGWLDLPPYLQKFFLFLTSFGPSLFLQFFPCIAAPMWWCFPGQKHAAAVRKQGRKCNISPNIFTFHPALRCALHTYLMLGSPQQPASSFVSERIIHVDVNNSNCSSQSLLLCVQSSAGIFLPLHGPLASFSEVSPKLISCHFPQTWVT